MNRDDPAKRILAGVNVVIAGLAGVAFTISVAIVLRMTTNKMANRFMACNAANEKADR